MSRVALSLGPVAVDGFTLLRSGIRWVLPDGAPCRAGQVAAFCNIGLAGAGAPFAAEGTELQVSLAPSRSGRLRHDPSLSHGGYLDRLAREPWLPDAVWGWLEDAENHEPAVTAPTGCETVLTFYSGRRMIDVAQDGPRLLAGWHDRPRAWTDAPGTTTLLGAGTCEQELLIRGEDGSFADMFARATGPVQLAICQDEPLVHSSAVLTETLARTCEEVAAIRADIARAFSSGNGPVPTGRDWAFIGALLNGLEQSPLDETYMQLGRAGLRTIGPAQAVCLSLTTELPPTARHKRLGYSLTMHGFRLAALSPALRHWLQRDFAFAPRPLDRIAEAYVSLAAGPRRLFVINCMSTPQLEVVQNYRLLDAATLHLLGGLRAKELNLMLHDIARSNGIAIVDADAIAADLGMLHHLPDYFHGTSTLIAEMRAELSHQLALGGIEGFAPATAPSLADQEFDRQV